MFKLSHVWFKYPISNDWLFNDLNLELNASSVAIIGANGSGKTTLLKLLMGVEKPEKGVILFDNRKLTRKMANKYFFFVPINPRNVLLGPTVKEELVNSCGGNCDIGDVKNVLGMFGLKDKMENKILHLSEGELRVVSVLSALLSGKRYIFMDEPTIGLDSKYRMILIELFEKYKDRRFIVATNDMRIIPGFEEVILLNKGEIVFKGSPTRFFLSASSETNENDHFYHPLAELLRKVGVFGDVDSLDVNVVAKMLLDLIKSSKR